MNLKLPILGLGGSTILVCLVGFAVSVVPIVVYTDAFWGVDGFVDKELFAFTQSDSPGVIVKQIASGSPAASAGVQKGDRIVTVNGRQVEFGTFRQLLFSIQPGEPVTLDVKRNGQDLRLVYKGESPTLEGVLLLDWQFVTAPVFLVLLVLLVATQPLTPPPLWRAILVALGGLAAMTVTVIVEVTQKLSPWTAVWQSQPIRHGPSPALHYLLALAVLLAGLVLSILGAFAVREVMMRKAPELATPNPI